MRERLFAEAGGQAHREEKQIALPGNPTPENFPVNLKVHLLDPETLSLVTTGSPNIEAASECLLGKDRFPALVFRMPEGQGNQERWASSCLPNSLAKAGATLAMEESCVQNLLLAISSIATPPVPLPSLGRGVSQPPSPSQGHSGPCHPISQLRAIFQNVNLIIPAL